MKKNAIELKKIRDLSLKQIATDIEKQKLEIINLKRQIRFGKVKNTAKIKQAKKQLARLNTILSEKAEQELTKVEK